MERGTSQVLCTMCAYLVDDRSVVLELVNVI